MEKVKVAGLILIVPFFVFLGLFPEQSFAEAPKKIKLVFMNPYAPSSNYSPFWSAQRRYWPEENIEAEVLDGRGGQDVLQGVASGSAQAGYVTQEVLKGIQEGMPIKIIAVGGQNDGSTIIALKGSGIKALKDFEGKKISQFPYGVITANIPKMMLKTKGVNLDKIKFINATPGDEVKLLMSGNIDGALGKVGYQSLHLYCQGYEPIEFAALEYGFDLYEFFVIVNAKWEKDTGYEGMVRFLKAIARAYLLRKTNVEQSVEDMIFYRQMERSFKKIRLAEFWTLLPRLVSSDVEKHGWGIITDEKMKRTQDVLFDIGFLNKKIDVKQYYDDRYLKDPSVQKIAKEFAQVPIDPKAEGYFKACRGQ